MIEKAKTNEQNSQFEEAKTFFSKSGVLFEEISRESSYDYYKEAARSYFSAQNYLQAKEMFLKKDCWNEAAESILKFIERENNADYRQLHNDALFLFRKADNAKKIIYCLENLKDYKNLIIELKKNEKDILDFKVYLAKNCLLYFKEVDLSLDKAKIEDNFVLYGKINIFATENSCKDLIITFREIRIGFFSFKRLPNIDLLGELPSFHKE